MKKFVRAFNMLWFLMVICSNLEAQTTEGQLHGTVIDKQSQTPLPGVNIVVYSQDKTLGTISDIAGNFYFERVSVGRVNLEFSTIGFEKQSIPNILISSAKAIFLTVELQEKVESLGEVMVKAHSKDQIINEFAMVSARSVTVEESNKYAGSRGDPARMVSNFAGVVTAGDQRNDIIIRGNSPTGLLWRLDGISIPNPNHFGTFGSTGGPICMLNNNQLSKSDFFTGAFPAEFGNATSGVFDLKLRNGNSQKHEFMGETSFNGFELGAEGPISKSAGSSYLINIRYTMMDVMTDMGMFKVGGVPKYADFSLKVSLPTKKWGTFSIIGVAGKSKINLEDANKTVTQSANGWTSEMLPGTNVLNGSGMSVIGITNKYFISKKQRIETTVSASYSNSFNYVDSLAGEDSFTFYNEKYSEIVYSLSTKYTLKINPANTFQAGASTELYNFNFFNETFFTPLNRFIQGMNNQGKSSLYQAFFQHKSRLTDKITVNWGLHSQLFALNKSVMIEPRLGINYSINSKQNIQLGYGLHGQTQPRLIYFTQTYSDSDGHYNSLTNQSLGFSKSHQAIIGYHWAISKNFHLKMESYYQHLYNIPVESKPSVFSIINYGANFHNDSNDSLINTGLGKNMGIELTIEKYLSKNFYGLLTASLYDSKYRASDMVWRNNAFNGNYTVNVLAGYEIPIRNDLLSINLKTVWAGGRRYIPIDLEASIQAGEAIYNERLAYTEKLADYFRTDFRISYRQNLRHISQEWSFDIQNLTNHRNIFSQRFDAGSLKIETIFQMGFFPIGSWKIFF